MVDSTKDGIRYQSLAVHIPNQFIGSKSKEIDTHRAFQGYAEKQSTKDEPLVVVSYFGDTNFSTPIKRFSSPSMGGHSSTGQTLNPQSSSSKKETHFMQSIPLSDGHKNHSVLQPSTLNYVFINPDSDNREAVDHPSFIQYVAHNSELVGKSDNLLQNSSRLSQAGLAPC